MPMITTAEIRRYLRAPNIQRVTDDIDLLRLHAVAAIETELGRAIDGTGRTSGATRAWPILRSFRGNGDGGSTAVETVSVASTGSRAALSTLSDYTARLVPLVSSWVLDVVTDRYKNRNPGASSESGGGVTVSYTGEALPPAVLRGVQRLRAELD